MVEHVQIYAQFIKDTVIKNLYSHTNCVSFKNELAKMFYEDRVNLGKY